MNEDDSQQQPTAQPQDSRPMAVWCPVCNRVSTPDDALLFTSFAGDDVYLCEICCGSCDELP